MSPFVVSTPTLELHLREHDPAFIERIIHRASGKTVCEGSRQAFLVRFPRQVSDPVFATQLSSVRSTNGSIWFRLSDEEGTTHVDCEIGSTAAGIRWSVKVTTPEPMWVLEWSLSNLELSRVVVPALGGQSLAGDMPTEMQVTYKYPFWWQAQFGVGEMPGGGGVWLRTLDVEPVMKLLRVRKLKEEPSLFGFGLGIEANAPLTSSELSAEWYLDGFDGDWKEPVDIHRRWLEESFDLVPYRHHPHYPAWMDEIDFIFEIWGMSKERPAPLHTFDQMIERIREFAGHHPPSRTILYLPAFAEGGIDSNAPDYNPAPRLGGREGFKRLVDEAHRLGYRVMIHTNVLAMTFTHRLFETFRDKQVVDPFGRPQVWGNDIDGDWLHEPFFAYINPGHREWGDHMEGVLGELIREFEIDAVFLDQTLLAFNDSRGPNFMKGMRSHVERLQRAFPGVLFAGEGLHEQVLAALPMAQIHGIDSIAGVHGLEGAREWRHVHPVSSYLFRKYTRLTAHLLTKHPSSSVFERQEEAYAELGVMPALVLYKEEHAVDTPALTRMLQRAIALDQGVVSE